MPSKRPEPDETMACRHCGRTDASDERVVVGVLEDIGDAICVDCRAEELEERTTLTELEADVAAWKQLGDLGTDEIASHLDVDASTIEECERQIQDRVENARERAVTLREEAELLERTASELRGI